MVNVQFSNITATIEDFPVISAKVLDAIIVIRTGEDVATSTQFNFTENDLVGGVLTKYHGLNQSLVDVSVKTNLNEEIEVPVSFDNSNTVSLDFSRIIPLVGTWTVLIEK